MFCLLSCLAYLLAQRWGSKHYMPTKNVVELLNSPIKISKKCPTLLEKTVSFDQKARDAWKMQFFSSTYQFL
jgi:hypothetical protein